MQKKFSDSFANPDFIISDFAKFERPAQLHIAFQALDKFCTEKGQLPRPYSKEDGAMFVEIAKELGTNGDYKVIFGCLCGLRNRDGGFSTCTRTCTMS